MPSKTDKMKKLTPLLKINFLRYKTLPFSPKRLVNVYGHKNAPCLWLSQWQEIQIFHTVCQRNFSTPEGRGIFRFLFTKIFFVFDFGHFLFLIICQFSPQCYIKIDRITSYLVRGFVCIFRL